MEYTVSILSEENRNEFAFIIFGYFLAEEKYPNDIVSAKISLKFLSQSNQIKVTIAYEERIIAAIYLM
jgi:hypothetical protein